MLASTGTGTRAVNCRYSSRLAQRLGEDHVGAGRDVGRGALERGRLALDRVRIGARHDDEARDRCGASTAALMRSTISAAGTSALPGRWPQRLADDLVLEVHAGGAGADQVARGAGDVEGAAPAGVGVDQQRQRARAADAPHVLADVVRAW